MLKEKKREASVTAAKMARPPPRGVGRVWTLRSLG